MATPVGLEGELYYGTAGTTAASELTAVRDVTLDMSASVADINSRASATWKAEKVAQLQATLTFEILNKVGDAGVIAIKNAFLAKGAIALYALDIAAVSGGEGLNADWNITNFSRSEPLVDSDKYSVTATINNELREPVWE